MTPEELKRIANEPGFGPGQRARDRINAILSCKKRLPDPMSVPEVEATSDKNRFPICSFNNSSEDGNDWHLSIHGYVLETDALGHDAKDDAEIIAAMLTAYRFGWLVWKDDTK